MKHLKTLKTFKTLRGGKSQSLHNIGHRFIH